MTEGGTVPNGARDHSSSQQVLFTKKQIIDIEGDQASFPHEMKQHSVSQELAPNGLKKSASSTKAASSFMPPLHKIYTTNTSHDLGDRVEGTHKKSKLPPRPTNKTKGGAGPSTFQNRSEALYGEQQVTRNIISINTNHNQ